jgi:hypothetical protein
MKYFNKFKINKYKKNITKGYMYDFNLIITNFNINELEPFINISDNKYITILLWLCNNADKYNKFDYIINFLDIYKNKLWYNPNNTQILKYTIMNNNEHFTIYIINRFGITCLYDKIDFLVNFMNLLKYSNATTINYLLNNFGILCNPYYINIYNRSIFELFILFLNKIMILKFISIYSILCKPSRYNILVMTLRLKHYWIVNKFILLFGKY